MRRRTKIAAALLADKRISPPTTNRHGEEESSSSSSTPKLRRSRQNNRGDDDDGTAAKYVDLSGCHRYLRWDNDDNENDGDFGDRHARPAVLTIIRCLSLSDLLCYRRDHKRSLALTTLTTKSKYWRCGDDGAGYYSPLHTALLEEKKVSLNSVQKIMRSHPDLLTEKGPLTIDMMTPLHTLMSSAPKKIDMDVLDLFIERYPPSSSSSSSSSMDLLEETLNLPTDVINVILEYVPHPALMQDGCGRTPLHILCSHTNMSSSASTTKILLRLASSEPRALSVVDERGCTPLHYYLSNEETGGGSNSSSGDDGFSFSGASNCIQTFDCLADLSPLSSLTIADHSGMTPLHVACMNGRDADADIIRSILHRASAKSAMARTSGGYLPLQGYVSIADWEEEGPVVANDDSKKEKFLAAVRDLAYAHPMALTTPFPRANFALMDYVREEGGHYQGPWRDEVEEIFQEVLEKEGEAGQ